MKKWISTMIWIAVFWLGMASAGAAETIMAGQSSFAVESTSVQVAYGQISNLAADDGEVQDEGFFQVLGTVTEGYAPFVTVIMYAIIFIFFAVVVLQVSGLLGALFWAAWALVRKILSQLYPEEAEEEQAEIQAEYHSQRELDQNYETVCIQKAKKIIFSYVQEGLKCFVKIYAPLIFILIPLYGIWWLYLCMKTCFQLLDQRKEASNALEQLLNDDDVWHYRKLLTIIMVVFIILLCWLAFLIVLVPVVYVVVFLGALIRELLL